MAVFATVVEQRSMSGAARLLAMSTSAVSQQVRQLERCNNQLSLQQMCVARIGIALLGRVDVADDLEAGRLAAVLPSWQLQPLDVWAVTPQRDAQPAKVRVAIGALEKYLTAAPGSLNWPASSRVSARQQDALVNLVDVGAPAKRHRQVEFVANDVERACDAGFAHCAQAVKKGASDQRALGAEGHGLEHVLP